MTETIILRPYEKSDTGFIFSSWRYSVWYDINDTPEIESEWYHHKTKEIKKLLSDPKTTVRIASLKSDPDHLVGYCVTNDSTVQFVYVKLDYRKQGIATILCRGLNLGDPVTKIGKSILRRVKENK